jgi:hypothetical protein
MLNGGKFTLRSVIIIIGKYLSQTPETMTQQCRYISPHIILQVSLELKDIRSFNVIMIFFLKPK